MMTTATYRVSTMIPAITIYCKWCSSLLPLTAFAPGGASGRYRQSPRCRSCRQAKDKAYYQIHKERRKETNTAWLAKQPIDYSSQNSKAWNLRNPDYRLDYKLKNLARMMWYGARNSAKKRGIYFAITPEHVIIPTVCPLLDIPLIVAASKKPTDNSPSLDRINNNYGYVPGNVMVISWRANLIKSVGTANEHIAIGTRLKALQIRRPLLALPSNIPVIEIVCEPHPGP